LRWLWHEWFNALSSIKKPNQVSKEAWAGWLKHQTMLINENRLNMADPRARQYLLKQVEKYFFEGGADMASGYVPPTQ
jgi:Fe-S cluster biosynthesis and repair protein YggX